MVFYVLVSILFFVGLYGVLTKKNIIKVVIGLMIMGHAVNLLFILLGYRPGGRAPILEQAEQVGQFACRAVDPLPQAMVLTSIVVDLAVVAFIAAVAIRLYEKYGTFDLDRIRRLKE